MSKYGINAWPEVIPADNSDWIDWPVGTEYNAPASMATAVYLDGEKKKVLRFEAA